ncbi:MAG: Membrane protein containing DoxX domain [uncultured Sulfurovum sp.]|uniref:Membrane protein containing DoxX domain n=1 Tax=uncultured Sulfurovum sp. TaxID=269237 RepID=A0A6S6RSJ4_9BACT|nr:MAG: Membrane protein containing DoxX domain [uncultured Sulfurovum sp.]
MEKNALRFLTVSLAVLLLFHGVDKIVNGIGSIEEMLEKLKIPYAQYIAYGVYIGEVLAPLMLVFNHFIRIALILISINMLVAIVLAHGTTLLTLSKHGAWSIETPMLYLVVSVTLFLLYTHKKIL